MSPAANDSDESGVTLPRVTTALFGHAEAEQTLLEAYRGGRVPHAWLIGGEQGIGKATLGYRLARFVLAHPDPSAPAVQKAKTLAVSPDHPVARRIAGQAHSDLLVLERTINDKGKLSQDILVENARRSVGFFGSTAGEGGWRIAIIDVVEDLNRSSANSLLKIIEEPPPLSLLLLVSHAPARVMPTIRSRCRKLMLRPLTVDDVVSAANAALGGDVDAAELRAAAEAADGSVGRALTLLEGDALELRKQVESLLNHLPNVDQRALHTLGDKIAGTEAEKLAAFMDAVNGWLSARLAGGAQDKSRMIRVAEAWEKVNRAGLEVETYNLDRKPFVFSVFGALAEAAR
ncbi:MAG: DNA polymerase III subunit delta' [Pseudomonadota bacterium]